MDTLDIISKTLELQRIRMQRILDLCRPVIQLNLDYVNQVNSISHQFTKTLSRVFPVYLEWLDSINHIVFNSQLERVHSLVEFIHREVRQHSEHLKSLIAMISLYDDYETELLIDYDIVEAIEPNQETILEDDIAPRAPPLDKIEIYYLMYLPFIVKAALFVEGLLLEDLVTSFLWWLISFIR